MWGDDAVHRGRHRPVTQCPNRGDGHIKLGESKAASSEQVMGGIWVAPSHSDTRGRMTPSPSTAAKLCAHVG